MNVKHICIFENTNNLTNNYIAFSDDFNTGPLKDFEFVFYLDKKMNSLKFLFFDKASDLYFVSNLFLTFDYYDLSTKNFNFLKGKRNDKIIHIYNEAEKEEDQMYFDMIKTCELFFEKLKNMNELRYLFLYKEKPTNIIKSYLKLVI